MVTGPERLTTGGAEPQPIPITSDITMSLCHHCTIPYQTGNNSAEEKGGRKIKGGGKDSEPSGLKIERERNMVVR